MKKHAPKFLKPTVFNPEGHWMVGVVWPVAGSKGNSYAVELHDKGFACECTGFAFHGKCKHSKSVLAQVEGAMA